MTRKSNHQVEDWSKARSLHLGTCHIISRGPVLVTLHKVMCPLPPPPSPLPVSGLSLVLTFFCCRKENELHKKTWPTAEKQLQLNSSWPPPHLHQPPFPYYKWQVLCSITWWTFSRLLIRLKFFIFYYCNFFIQSLVTFLSFSFIITFFVFLYLRKPIFYRLLCTERRRTCSISCHLSL